MRTTTLCGRDVPQVTAPRPEAAALVRADLALRNQPPTVMEKTLMPSGWDMHDYSSLARYYWPDLTGGRPFLLALQP